jgi:ribonucleoside-diphosphate reductase alpha chain
MDGTKLVYMNKLLENKLEEIGLNTPEIREKIAEKGTIKDIKEIPEEVRRVFVSSQDISGEDHVLMQAAFQRHTDNAVSKTVNLPNDATEKDVEDIYMIAYKTDCKGVTVYRDGSRSTQVMTTGKTKYEGETPEYGHIKPREPGEYMEGVSHKETIGCGSLHVTINRDEQGLAEVYTSTGANGGCPAQSEAVARLTSLALRSGIDFDEIVKQLSSPRCMSCMHLKAKDPNAIKVKSCPHAIALALIHEHERLGLSDKEKKAPSIEIKEEPKKEKVTDIPSNSAEITVCPECGAKVSHEGGCVVCPSCGWSKCG